MIELAETGREEWLARRRRGIGSSDIAIILGLHPTRTPYDVYCEKRELVPDREADERMEWGKELEQVIARRWARSRDVQIQWMDMTITTDDERVFATPDFVIVGSHDGGECKNIGYQDEQWGEEETDQLPEIYAAQAQWVSLVTKWERVWVPALFGGNRLKTYLVHADRELQKQMRAYGLEWWEEHVEKEEPPPIDYSESASSYLRSRFPAAVEPVRAATEEEGQLVVEFARARSLRKAAERQYETLSNQLREKIGDSKAIVGEDFKVSWFDVKASSYTVNRRAGRRLQASGALFKQEGEER